MCGYIGFTSKLSAEEKSRLIAPMMDRIIHRGPDMASSYVDGDIALGFRRLSIIDLSEAGNQPMQNEDGTVAVVFNGEIYNFMDLREELLAKGHTFHSGADTEVLVHGFEEWGEGLVQRLRGMFSFVAWDAKAHTLLAARDPFGIKPFYYTRLPDGNLLFGSEIKSFLDHPDFVKEMNPAALRPYLTFQYAAGEETFFKGVYSLPQGHYFLWKGKNSRITPVCYWDFPFGEDGDFTFEQCADEIDEAVRESVAAHKISDVPVGSFLSGGVDSSFITACLQPENSFSVGFSDDNFDESQHAAELSEKIGVENFRQILTAEECFEAFPDIQYHMDQPQSNPSSVPLWFLAKLARQQVTVVLSGEGADELFAGYDLYVDTPAMEKFKRMPLGLRRAMGKLAKAIPAVKGKNFLLKSAERPEDWFIGQAEVFPENEAVSVLKPAYLNGPSPLAMTRPFYAKVQNESEVEKKQYVDMHLWLPGDILLKADKMCMAHSLELRVPFLDKKVAQLAGRVPNRYRIVGTQNKWVFRVAANKILPDEWATRPKKGFPVPIRNWLRERRYYDIVRGYFESEFAAEFFDPIKILDLLDDHFHGRANNGRKIWTVFTFLVWYKRFFIDESAAKAAESTS